MSAVDLLALADRVEALTGPCREVDAAILAALGTHVLEKRNKDRRAWWCDIESDHRGYDPQPSVGWPPNVPRYTASLDDAMTLVPDGYAVELSQWHPIYGTRAHLLPLHQDGDRWLHRGSDPHFTGRAATLALALSAAALRALASLQVTS